MGRILVNSIVEYFLQLRFSLGGGLHPPLASNIGIAWEVLALNFEMFAQLRLPGIRDNETLAFANVSV